jgi:hypothetical protein
MSDIARRSQADLKPLDPGLSAEILIWVSELRVIWAATGLSLNQFTALHSPIDKGTISRYLNGRRVPRDPWFLDKLLAVQADNGQPVTPAVREHLTTLHLRALEAAHPHEYRVRLVHDELKIALTGKREAERYARDLEGQLIERNRQVTELVEDKTRLQTAWDADYLRLTREINEITDQLGLARDRACEAEQRCQQLEDLLNHLDAPQEASSAGQPPLVPASSVQTLILGVDRDGHVIQHERNAPWILARDSAELLGAQLSDLTSDSVRANSHGVQGLLSAIRHEREGNAMLTINGRDGSPTRVVATAHPMYDQGTSLAALVQLRMPAPREERFVDPALMRRQMIDDTFPRVSDSLDIHHLGHELIAALVPNFCNIGHMLLSESLVADGKISAHEPEEPPTLHRIAVQRDSKDPRWEAVFPTGEIVRYPVGARSPCAQCMTSGKPVLKPYISPEDARAISREWRRKPMARLLLDTSLLMLPLVARSTVLGFFACIRQPESRRFDAYDQNIGMDFASKAAAIIEGLYTDAKAS